MPAAPVRRLDANGDYTFGRGTDNYATGAEATAQRLKTRLRLVQGECFLDTGAGVPWWQGDDPTVKPIMGGPRDLGYTGAVLKATILGTDGVATLQSFSVTFDANTRRLTVSATVTTDDGDIASIVVESP